MTLEVFSFNIQTNFEKDGDCIWSKAEILQTKPEFYDVSSAIHFFGYLTIMNDIFFTKKRNGTT
jgi:hypothetical protein